MAGDDIALVAYLEPAIGVFEDLHLDSSVAGMLCAGQQLQGTPLVFDRVVPGHLAGVLEAEDPVQWPLRAPRTAGRFGQFTKDGKLGLVARQEVPQHGVGLVDGLGPGQAEFGHQPLLKGSRGPFDASLGLRGTAKGLLDAQFLHGPAEVSSLHRTLDVPGIAGKLEGAMAVSVKGDGAAPALDQALHQGEIAAVILLGTEHRVDHGACGVVHRQEQGELRTVIAQPRVMAAVHLDQHPFSGQALAAHPVLGRTP